MIAKRVRRRGGQGLAALVRYVLREAGPPRDWTRRADGAAGGEVDRVRESGCGAVADPGRAVRLMELTVAANPTVRAGRPLEAGYHLVVSFAPGERPGPTALDDIEDSLVEAVGLSEHQRISAAHRDRGHYHLHVVVNLVHPVRLKKADLRFDKFALSAACAELERRHGLVRTNHGEVAPALAERVREAAGPALVRAAEAGGGWAAVHGAAAEHGLALRKLGGGLALAPAGGADGRVRIKAGPVDRTLSLPELERRLGPYRPAAPEVLAKAAAAPFRSAPDGRAGQGKGVAPPPRGFAADEAELYRRYRAEEARTAERRGRAVAQVRAEHREGRRALSAWHAERTGARGLAPAERERRRARRRAEVAEAREREAVALAAGAHPALAWRGFLESEAGRGEPSALEALRRRGWVPWVGPVGADPDAAGPVPHRHLRPHLRPDGGRAYTLRDGGRVVDAGSCLRLERVTEGAIRFALDLAAERWAGAPLRLEGSEAFRRRAATAAGERRVAVVFDDAGLEALRRAAGGPAPAEQARAREERAAAAAEAAEARRRARGTPRLAWAPSRQDRTRGPPDRDPGRGRGGPSR